MSSALLERVEAAVKSSIVEWRKPDCGLSRAHRFSVGLDTGAHIFVKAAIDDETEGWLRREHYVLSGLASACMPRILHWLDEPDRFPVLIVQDLSHAYWPASHRGVIWRNGDLERLYLAIENISTLPELPGLPPLKNPVQSGWQRIVERPREFLDLKLCSPSWFRHHAELLMNAEMDVQLAGDRITHGDLRSDNICFLKDRVVFVDWSNAARGNGTQNLASVLAALHLEGGPKPDELLPDGAPWAARSSSLLIKRVTRDGWDPAWLKRVLTKLIAIDLEWFAMSSKADPPDGLPWTDL